MALVLESPQSVLGSIDDDLVDMGWRPVFDEHTGDDGTVYDRTLLARIAQNNNDRIEDTGDFSPLVEWHTDDDKNPATDPPVVGLTGPFKVDKFGKKKPRWCIFAKIRVFKDKLATYRKRPRLSVEIWPEDKPENRYIDPIAILGAETPRRDLGLAYSKSATGQRAPYRYAMNCKPDKYVASAGSEKTQRTVTPLWERSENRGGHEHNWNMPDGSSYQISLHPDSNYKTWEVAHFNGKSGDAGKWTTLGSVPITASDKQDFRGFSKSLENDITKAKRIAVNHAIENGKIPEDVALHKDFEYAKQPDKYVETPASDWHKDNPYWPDTVTGPATAKEKQSVDLENRYRDKSDELVEGGFATLAKNDPNVAKDVSRQRVTVATASDPNLKGMALVKEIGKLPAHEQDAIRSVSRPTDTHETTLRDLQKRIIQKELRSITPRKPKAEPIVEPDVDTVEASDDDTVIASDESPGSRFLRERHLRGEPHKLPVPRTSAERREMLYEHPTQAGQVAQQLYEQFSIHLDAVQQLEAAGEYSDAFHGHKNKMYRLAHQLVPLIRQAKGLDEKSASAFMKSFQGADEAKEQLQDTRFQPEGKPLFKFEKADQYGKYDFTNIDDVLSQVEENIPSEMSLDLADERGPMEHEDLDVPAAMEVEDFDDSIDEPPIQTPPATDTAIADTGHDSTVIDGGDVDPNAIPDKITQRILASGNPKLVENLGWMFKPQDIPRSPAQFDQWLRSENVDYAFSELTDLHKVSETLEQMAKQRSAAQPANKTLADNAKKFANYRAMVSNTLARLNNARTEGGQSGKGKRRWSKKSATNQPQRNSFPSAGNTFTPQPIQNAKGEPMLSQEDLAQLIQALTPVIQAQIDEAMSAKGDGLDDEGLGGPVDAAAGEVPGDMPIDPAAPPMAGGEPGGEPALDGAPLPEEDKGKALFAKRGAKNRGARPLKDTIERYRKERSYYKEKYEKAVGGFNKLRTQALHAQEQLEAAMSEVNELRDESTKAARIKILYRKQAEGIVIDPEQEYEDTASFTTEQFDNHVNKTMPMKYSKIPLGDMIPVDDEAPAVRLAKQSAAKKMDATAAKAGEVVMRYRKEGKELHYGKVLSHMIENNDKFDLVTFEKTT